MCTTTEILVNIAVFEGIAEKRVLDESGWRETKGYLKGKTNILYKKTIYNDDADDSPLGKCFGGKKNK